MKDLCDGLTARRRGAARSASSANAIVGKTKSRSGDDFWGGGGGGGGSATRGAAGSAPALSGRGGGQGRQDGKQQQKSHKAKGKVYQKAAAEDFWGGGTASGRSTPANSAPASAPAAPPSTVPTASAVGSTKIDSKGKSKKGGGGKLPASKPIATAVAATKRPAQPPLATKPTSVTKGGSKVGGGFPSGGGAAGFTTKPAAALTAAADSTPTEWPRVTCQCMGTKHDLVTNCTTCGKIACVIEGGLGCSFCGSALPVTGREPRHGSTGGNGSETIRSTERDGSFQSAALKEALARKDKLLLFDRTSASRTRVLDDQGDYFTSHNWLSQKEREKGEAEEKSRRDDAAERRGARRQVKLSIDIMGRRVVETEQQMDGYGAGDVSKQEDGSTTADAATEGSSFDFGASTASDTGGAAAAGNAGGSSGQFTASEETAGPRRGGISLENTGLRGRAKVVYDVMRANLEKQGRRRPGAIKKGGAAGADQSRVSLWRVQHDVDSDDILRQERQNRRNDGGSPDGFQKFDPADELACSSR